jgi:hypothetical protein
LGQFTESKNMRQTAIDLTTPLVHLTLKSRNTKTGPMPVSTTGRASCPDTCGLKKAGCYGESGPIAWHWSKVTSGAKGLPWNQFCAQIEALPEGTLWRHNQVGDLPHADGFISRPHVFMLAGANVARRGFTYTHHLPHKGQNLKTLLAINELGFTVNLSANTLDEADALYGLGLPVVCVLPMNQTENAMTPEGRKVVVCPAAIRDDVSCSTCAICASSDRTTVIGFPAHGTGKQKVEKVFWAKPAETQPQPQPELETV